MAIGSPSGYYGGGGFGGRMILGKCSVAKEKT